MPEALPVEVVAETRARKARNQRANRYTAFDSALIKAAREKLPVSVHLAVETSFTDEDGFFIGTVKTVDIYSILFIVEAKGVLREVWISKPHIVSAEIDR